MERKLLGNKQRSRCFYRATLHYNRRPVVSCFQTIFHWENCHHHDKQAFNGESQSDIKSKRYGGDSNIDDGVGVCWVAGEWIMFRNNKKNAHKMGLHDTPF